MRTLLAVDLGITTGLALYGQDGRLHWYRSHNFGSRARLKRGIRGLLTRSPSIVWIVIEGGGPLIRIWERVAEQRGIPICQIQAEVWRRRLFYPREQRSGVLAKRHAGIMARRVIDWSKAARPTALRHDTAEAIMIGLWGVIDLGWLDEVPPGVR